RLSSVQRSLPHLISTRFPYTTLFRSHLTAEQEDQVLSVEAEQTLKDEARRARCRLDPSCNVQSLPIDLESQQKAIKELLGAEKLDRKSTRLNSSHRTISYAVFCLKKK